MTQPLELFSEESERNVLSILIQNPERLFDSLEIAPFFFSSLPHQLIFKTISKLGADGLSSEPTLIIEHLRVGGDLERAGTEDYILHLASKECNPDNYKEYERIVINSYKGRTLLSIIQKVPGLIKETRDISAVIEYVKTSLTGLLLTAGGEKTIPLGTALKSQWEKIKERVKNPGVTGWSTGFISIDWITNGVSPGDLFIVAGRPSQGKSAWMLNSALKVTEPLLIFSKEMGMGSLTDRILSIHSGVNATNIQQGTLSQEDIETLAKSSEELTEKEIFLDTYFSSDLPYILSTIRKYHKLYGIKIVYLDYIQLLAERGDGSVHELGEISRSLKLIANELDIGVIMFSQLNRSVESREDKRPILSDLRQSGNLEEDADVVIFLYRDEYYNESTERKGLMENIIRKNRDGKVGTVVLNFIPETVSIVDPKGETARYERRTISK